MIPLVDLICQCVEGPRGSVDVGNLHKLCILQDKWRTKSGNHLKSELPIWAEADQANNGQNLCTWQHSQFPRYSVNVSVLYWIKGTKDCCIRGSVKQLKCSFKFEWP
jgi:hypothetical protein